MSILYKPATQNVVHTVAALPFQSGQGNNVNSGHLVALSVESAYVDTTHFTSGHEGRYEGVMELEVGGQSTVLTFVGKPDANGHIKVDQKFMDKVLYFGLAKDLDSVNLRMLESDEETRKFLEGLREALSLVAGSPVAAAHPAVGPGLNFIAGITSLIKSNIQDDDECVAYLLREGELREGNFTIQLDVGQYRPDGQFVSRGTLLVINCVLLDLGAPVQNNEGVSIRLTRASIDLTSGTSGSSEDIKRRIEALKRQLAAATKTAQKKMIQKQIDILVNGGSNVHSRFGRAMPNFNIEVGGTGGAKGWSSRLPDIESQMVLQNLQLAKVTAKKIGGAAGVSVIPINFEVGRSPDEFDAQEYFATLETGKKFLEAVRGEQITVPDFVEEKVLPSALGFLTEYLSQSLTIYSFNGVILLQDDANSFPQGSRNGFLVFSRDAASSTWSATVNKEVTWRGKRVGSVELEFQVVAL